MVQTPTRSIVRMFVAISAVGCVCAALLIVLSSSVGDRLLYSGLLVGQIFITLAFRRMGRPYFSKPGFASGWLRASALPRTASSRRVDAK